MGTGSGADAVSRDGFVNNRDTLQLSPLLLEAYFDIADQALTRCLVDPKSKPTIQNFRVDLGAATGNCFAFAAKTQSCGSRIERRCEPRRSVPKS